MHVSLSLPELTHAHTQVRKNTTHTQASVATDMQIHTHKHFSSLSTYTHTTFLFYFLSGGRVHPQVSPPRLTAATTPTTAAAAACISHQHTGSAADPR